MKKENNNRVLVDKNWIVCIEKEFEKLDCEGAVRVYKECGGCDKRLLGIVERKNEIVLKLKKLVEIEEVKRNGK